MPSHVSANAHSPPTWPACWLPPRLALKTEALFTNMLQHASFQDVSSLPHPLDLSPCSFHGHSSLWSAPLFMKC